MHNFLFGIESLLPGTVGTYVGLFDYSHRSLSQVDLYSSPLTLTLKKYLSTTYFYGKHLSDLTPKMHWTWLLKSYCTSVNPCYTASIHSSALTVHFLSCYYIHTILGSGLGRGLAHSPDPRPGVCQHLKF